MSDMKRRVVLKGAALGALAYTVGGVELLLTPRQARAQNVPIKVLTPNEVATFEALGDVLVPGAKAAGVAYYVDHQLDVDPEDALLLARSVNIAPPYVNFYRAALAGVDNASVAMYGAKFAALPEDKQSQFVDQMRQKNPQGWSGPGSPFFYYVARNDAIDVYYGTVEGFERLGVPYMPHILPVKKW
ncbi:MAG: gluconate 2-dehydrogenase subunit 3 family protein [Stellaceae bacterium]